MINRRPRFLHLLCTALWQGTSKNPRTFRKKDWTWLPVLWSGHVVVYTGHYSNQPSSEAEQGKKINEVNISGLSDCRETLVTQRGRILVVYLIALTNELLFIIIIIITIITIFFLIGKRLLHFNNASSCTRVPSSSVFCGTFSLQCYCVVLLSCLIVSACNTFHQEMFIHMIMFFLHDSR